MLKRHDVSRFARFLVSGITAASVEYLSFVLLYQYITRALILSNVTSFGLGLITSFLLNKRWVFNHEGDTKRQVIRYITLALVNVILSTILVWLAVFSLGIPGWFAKLFVMVLIATWNYLLFSKLIFVKRKAD